MPPISFWNPERKVRKFKIIDKLIKFFEKYLGFEEYFKDESKKLE